MQDTITGIIYMYDRILDSTQRLNPNNINRIDQKNQQVTLHSEVINKLPDRGLISLYCGILNDPTKVAIYFKNELVTEDKNLLSEIVYRHKNNIPDKYAVWYQDSFVEDPGNSGSAYLFNTEEQAQQFIINDNLEGAVVKGVVVL